MHPVRLVYMLRVYHISDVYLKNLNIQQSQPNMHGYEHDLLDLSRFTPDPKNTKTVYRFRIDDNCIIVYARRPDNILPYDKLKVTFHRDGRTEINLPTKAPKNELYKFMAEKMTSFGWSCMVLNALFLMPVPDWLLASTLHKRACVLAGQMPIEKKLYYRQWLSMNANVYGWPPMYQQQMCGVL